MAADLSQLDLVAIQIDGLHIGCDLVLVAALGIDADGNKHPLGLMEGATENAAVVQALIDNLIERQGNRVKGLCGEEAFEEVVVPSCGFSFEAQ
jgi:hypothetical protein